MITDINRRTRYAPKKELDLWSDLTPFDYSLTHLGKEFNLDARVAKNGDILLQLPMHGNAKDGSDEATVGVRLKKIRH
jgi:hypothetical protein